MAIRRFGDLLNLLKCRCYTDPPCIVVNRPRMTEHLFHKGRDTYKSVKMPMRTDS